MFVVFVFFKAPEAPNDFALSFILQRFTLFMTHYAAN